MSSKRSPIKKEPQKQGIRSRQKSGGSFLPTLFAILERSELGNGKTMISWVHGGKALKVHNRDLFIGKVMPEHFTTCTWSNFTLQLKWYGFDRIGHDTFSHKNFTRSNRNRSERIERLKQLKAWPEPPPPPPQASLSSDEKDENKTKRGGTKKKGAPKKAPPKSKVSRPQKKKSLSLAVAKKNDNDDESSSTASADEVESRKRAASKPPPKRQSKRNVPGKGDDKKMTAVASGSRKGQPKTTDIRKSGERKSQVATSSKRKDEADSDDDDKSERKELKFAMKVMAIMEQSESDARTKDIVSWVDNGTAFQIYDRKKFVADVLPLHFGKIQFATNFASRLRWHGFEKVRYDVYRHKNFNRQHPKQCEQIQRLKDLKGTVWPLDRDLKKRKGESKPVAQKEKKSMELEADSKLPNRLESVNVEMGEKRKSDENEHPRKVRRKIDQQPAEMEEESSGLFSSSCSIM